MKLNKNNELVVLRASGYSIWFLILPAVFNALLISILYVFVFNPIFAYMNIKFKNYESNFSKVWTIFNFRDGIVVEKTMTLNMLSMLNIILSKIIH